MAGAWPSRSLVARCLVDWCFRFTGGDDCLDGCFDRASECSSGGCWQVLANKRHCECSECWVARTKGDQGVRPITRRREKTIVGICRESERTGDALDFLWPRRRPRAGLTSVEQGVAQADRPGEGPLRDARGFPKLTQSLTVAVHAASLVLLVPQFFNCYGSHMATSCQHAPTWQQYSTGLARRVAPSTFVS